MTSITTPFPAIDGGFSLALGAQPFNNLPILTEDSTSEDENISERSHRDSIGKSSTTSWPAEEVHTPENEQPLGHQKQSWVESKKCCTWTAEKENVCFSVL